MVFCPLRVGRSAPSGYDQAAAAAGQQGASTWSANRHLFFPSAARNTMRLDEAAMNVQPNLRMDKSAFIAWMQANEGRYELAGGRVVMMPGGLWMDWHISGSRL
jgi:hypothetical protein